jgi:hypothetical protein
MQGNEISHWYIGDDLKNARIVDCDAQRPYQVQQMGNGVTMIDWTHVDLNEIDEGHPVSSKIWSQKLNIHHGDLLHLAPFPKKVLFLIPKNVHTLKQLLQFINLKLNSPIDKQYKKIAEKWMSRFYIDMTDDFKKLEKNELTWFEILGDYCAWGGGLKRSKSGIWTYIVNS